LEKCCPGLGCFDLGPPWATPLRIVPPPRCKEEAPVYFYLFTRANRMSKYSIQTWPKISLKGSNFDGLRNTVFYFHGWQSEPLTSRSTRSLDIKNAFLKLMDANVILVDYTSSSSSTYYPQSVSDIRVVAAQVARLARYLIDTWGASASRMHMIGLSLGAQAAAYSARGVSGVARLTGLDPAGPLFENQDKKVRINEGDAILVEVLHTNGLILGSLGMSRPAGKYIHVLLGRY
ncbi:Pancreatic lipase-related protein 2, partial [Blattella germanica]